MTRSEDRLAAYLAVENTYLSTFQALGGLGLVLGSLGLAVVLLRAVWERRAELALLRALGYRRRMLAWLVLAENSFLLLVGLVMGAVSALLSILPQLLTGAGRCRGSTSLCCSPACWRWRCSPVPPPWPAPCGRRSCPRCDVSDGSGTGWKPGPRRMENPR